MKLKHWKEEKKDLKDYPSSIIDDKESLLANSVTAANFDFISKLDSHENVLVKKEVSANKIQAALRVASVINATSLSIDSISN